jgi:hypothetical protein
MRKRKGDKGHPYLGPLDRLKKEDGDPFTKTTKEAISIQLMIQFTVC